MTKDKQTHRSRFHKAKDDAQFAQQATSTPQTASEAYKLAFQDTDFLLREDLRPVRFQLELLKPELLLDEAKIESTLVIYGSARIPEPDQADGLEAAATDDASRNIARRLKADLFISIHADAAENEEAHGASVYTLSEVASDREAARLAARENKANIINGVDLGAHGLDRGGVLGPGGLKGLTPIGQLFPQHLERLFRGRLGPDCRLGAGGHIYPGVVIDVLRKNGNHAADQQRGHQHDPKGGLS